MIPEEVIKNAFERGRLTLGSPTYSTGDPGIYGGRTHHFNAAKDVDIDSRYMLYELPDLNIDRRVETIHQPSPIYVYRYAPSPVGDMLERHFNETPPTQWQDPRNRSNAVHVWRDPKSPLYTRPLFGHFPLEPLELDDWLRRMKSKNLNGTLLNVSLGQNCGSQMFEKPSGVIDLMATLVRWLPQLALNLTCMPPGPMQLAPISLEANQQNVAHYPEYFHSTIYHECNFSCLHTALMHYMNETHLSFVQHFPYSPAQGVTPVSFLEMASYQLAHYDSRMLLNDMHSPCLFSYVREPLEAERWWERLVENLHFLDSPSLLSVAFWFIFLSLFTRLLIYLRGKFYSKDAPNSEKLPRAKHDPDNGPVTVYRMSGNERVIDVTIVRVGRPQRQIDNFLEQASPVSAPPVVRDVRPDPRTVSTDPDARLGFIFWSYGIALLSQTDSHLTRLVCRFPTIAIPWTLWGFIGASLFASNTLFCLMHPNYLRLTTLKEVADLIRTHPDEVDVSLNSNLGFATYMYAPFDADWRAVTGRWQEAVTFAQRYLRGVSQPSELQIPDSAKDYQKVYTVNSPAYESRRHVFFIAEHDCLKRQFANGPIGGLCSIDECQKWFHATNWAVWNMRGDPRVAHLYPNVTRILFAMTESGLNERNFAGHLLTRQDLVEASRLHAKKSVNILREMNMHAVLPPVCLLTTLTAFSLLVFANEIRHKLNTTGRRLIIFIERLISWFIFRTIQRIQTSVMDRIRTLTICIYNACAPISRHK